MEYPYRECVKCTSLADCKNIEVIENGFGTPIPPDDCPKKEDYAEIQ